MIILLGSAGVSFALAILEDGEGMTAFVDPAVVGAPFSSSFTPPRPPFSAEGSIYAKDLVLRFSRFLS